jgi:hypothetical protein
MPIAAGLDEKRDLNRAVLMARAEGAGVLDRGVRLAYTERTGDSSSLREVPACSAQIVLAAFNAAFFASFDPTITASSSQLILIPFGLVVLPLHQTMPVIVR